MLKSEFKYFFFFLFLFFPHWFRHRVYYRLHQTLSPRPLLPIRKVTVHLLQRLLQELVKVLKGREPGTFINFLITLLHACMVFIVDSDGFEFEKRTE